MEDKVIGGFTLDDIVTEEIVEPKPKPKKKRGPTKAEVKKEILRLLSQVRANQGRGARTNKLIDSLKKYIEENL